MKYLYRFYAVCNHFYHSNRRAKACFNWFVGKFCSSSLGQSVYFIIKRRYMNFPKRIQIETTSYCNARCVMCPHHIMPRRNRHMEQKLFESIISELSEHRDELRVLSLHFLGEPLMDPNLFERIRQVKDVGIREVQLNTNAQLLDEEKAKQLIESGIDTVTFSLDGLQPEIQEKRREGTSLSTVVRNIDFFIQSVKKNSFSKKKPKTIIYTIKSSPKDTAWKAIVKKYKGMVDSIAVINQNNWGGGTINIEKEQNLTNYRIPCPLIFSTMPINVEGKANLCCLDYADREIMGDLHEKTIYDVWNGKMEKYRLLHMKNQSELIPFCKECSLYR